MANKTNKTAHVLKLISKAKEEHNLDDNLEIEPNESGITKDLSFIDIDISNDNEVSEKVKEKLSEMVENENADGIKNDVQKETLISENQSVKNDDNTAINVNETEDKTEDSKSIANVSVEITPQSAAAKTAESTSNENVQQEDCSKNLGYKYVNVLEEIVKSRIDEFLKLFDVCTCPRCKCDVMALALGGLPSKYIVVDSSYVSPLLNFYSNRYMGAVTAQLSHACTVVKNNPHH